jgi:hypothetical protein
VIKRNEYLSDRHVAGFVDWAGHLVRGERQLKHSWNGKGPSFRCQTIYEAFQRYRWPNSVNGDRFTDTVRKFDRFRQEFEHVGAISSRGDQCQFIATAKAVADWGGIRRLKFDHWELMTPSQLQAHIDDIRSRLDPATGDTNNLRGIRMTSGFSKIYAALIPGLPIYDSRVACAQTCLVRLYCRYADLSTTPSFLNLGMPQPYGNKEGRCRQTISREQSEDYAKANLQFAWLMQGLVAEPGDFSEVPENLRVDALQSALFMLGYTKLQDDAVVKPR